MTQFVACLIAIALAAQAQAPAVRRDSVIRSQTRLVEVHVAAWDNQGRRVTDLERENFQIFDDGKARPIVAFAADGKSLSVQEGAQSEAGGALGEEDGYTVILLDWLNSLDADRLRGDDAVRKVLSSIPVRQDIAVYVLGTELPNAEHPLAMVSGFGNRRQDIAGMVPDLMILPGPEVIDPSRPARRTRPSVEMQLFDWNNRIKDTMRGLTDLADRMARLPGRKSVIWMSTGFPTTIDGSVVPGVKKAAAVYVTEVEHLLARFNRLNIAVHTVNTSGLPVANPIFDDTLRAVAERTGGTYFGDRNDLDVGVQVAMEDMHAGYTLGFAVPEGAAPGMHRITVRSRKRNLKLSYRELYDVTQ